jgi:hypothetical protein
MSARKLPGPPAGYVFCVEDGLFRRKCVFPGRKHLLVEVLVRDRTGRLVRVERPGRFLPLP